MRGVSIMTTQRTINFGELVGERTSVFSAILFIDHGSTKVNITIIALIYKSDL